MIRRAGPLIVGSLLVITSCRESTSPYQAIETRVEVEPLRAAVGEALHLRAIATNHGDRVVEVGYGCGGGLDFEVRLPTGERQFLLRGLPSLCPVYDTNVLEPGETDTLTYEWTVPGPPGTYRVWAGARVASGIAARSSAVEVLIE